MEHVTTFLIAFAHITGWAAWLVLFATGAYNLIERFDRSGYGHESNLRAVLSAMLIIALAALAITLVPILYPRA